MFDNRNLHYYIITKVKMLTGTNVCIFEACTCSWEFKFATK